MPSRRILVVVNSTWNITNFRMGLLSALKADGCEILIASPHGPERAAIEEAGFTFFPLPLRPKGRNPFREAQTFIALLSLIVSQRPGAVMTYTVKPNIYGGIAARIAGVDFVPNVAGLGAAFAKPGWLQGVVTRLYRLALQKAKVVFFQNVEDRRLFVEKRVVAAARARVLPGSGVDLAKFAARPMPSGPARFAMIARLVADKGVREFVEAARRVRRTHSCEMVLAGFLEPEHRGSVTEAEIAAWRQEGLLTYLGPLKDVRSLLGDVHALVLPSYYREGTPRSLLEAAAMARIVITTDHPGCRDAVVDQVTGYAVTPRDIESLAEAMDKVCTMSLAQREEMGAAGRRLAEERFSEDRVVDAYREALTLSTFPAIGRPDMAAATQEPMIL